MSSFRSSIAPNQELVSLLRNNPQSHGQSRVTVDGHTFSPTPIVAQINDLKDDPKHAGMKGYVVSTGDDDEKNQSILVSERNKLRNQQPAEPSGNDTTDPESIDLGILSADQIIGIKMFQNDDDDEKDHFVVERKLYDHEEGQDDSEVDCSVKCPGYRPNVNKFIDGYDGYGAFLSDLVEYCYYEGIVFGSCPNALRTTPIGCWDVSRVRTFSWTFAGLRDTEFNEDLSCWDTGSASDMYQMFKGTKGFNQDLNNWKIDKVTSIGNMFQDATDFNQCLSTWKSTFCTTATFKDRCFELGFTTMFEGSGCTFQSFAEADALESPMWCQTENECFPSAAPSTRPSQSTEPSSRPSRLPSTNPSSFPSSTPTTKSMKNAKKHPKNAKMGKKYPKQ